MPFNIDPELKTKINLAGPDFFQVGKTYMLHGYPHTVLAVADCLYGPLAWATFPRGNGLDCQTLCQIHFEEAEIVPQTDPHGKPMVCPNCNQHNTLRSAETWSGNPEDGPDYVIYCEHCEWEDYV